MSLFPELESPSIVIDDERLDANLRHMQSVCDAHGVELWPHIKTHKIVPILRRQLALGARGATCAKLGEAEAMLPSGVRRIFIAHSLVDLAKAERLHALAGKLDQLILAVTSEAHFEALERLLEAASISVLVLLAVDTGLGREGVRQPERSAEIAARIRGSKRMNLLGIYTHEGHTYGVDGPEEADTRVREVHRILTAHAEAIGGDVTLWPGCSVSATRMVALPGVHAVRPGAYVFNDLALGERTKIVPMEDCALTVLATVVDRPEPGLALIDAGSKVFSGDKTREGFSGRCLEYPDIFVRRVNEEHGYLAGESVDRLNLGDRLRFVPAHVCPVVNLASEVALVRQNRVIERWKVDARGRSD
jgi:D-serine deaminase-like pyridoxal phosphate-dependent protein